MKVVRQGQLKTTMLLFVMPQVARVDRHNATIHSFIDID